MFVKVTYQNYAHLHVLTETYEGYLPGYYFSDEIEDIHGPFATVEEAAKLFDRYCEQNFPLEPAPALSGAQTKTTKD